MTGVHAEILIGVNFAAPAHNESFERPVACADPKLFAAGVIKLIHAADDHFLQRRIGQAAGSVFILCTTIIERMIDGMPSAAA